MEEEGASLEAPEFEFWVPGNNPSSLLHVPLLSADVLFAGGVLLPLHPLPPPADTPPPPPPSSSSLTAAKKQWKEVFNVAAPLDKERRRASFAAAAAPGTAASELNVHHLWPFRRSRSAGSGRHRNMTVPGAGSGWKTGSAPCSRSNSRGECSGSGRWTRGIHLGRPGPVWQLRRSGGKGAAEPRDAGEARTKGGEDVKKVLRFNVNTCIGYRNRLRCRGNGAAGDRAGAGGVVAGGNGSLFGLKALFSKKVC